MSSSKKNTIRFAVGTPDDPQSWIWRFWVHKDEVYLGAKDALQVFKVSLHNSGIWRVAFVKELNSKDNVNDRVILRWKKPEEFIHVWTPSIALLVSSIKPQRPLAKGKIQDDRITCLNEAVNGERIVLRIIFSIPKMSTTDLQKVLTSSDKLVGSLKKKNGEKVWLIKCKNKLTSIETAKIKDVMDKTKIHLKAESTEDTIYGARALLVVSEDVPTALTQPTIFDIALGKENIEIDKLWL